MFVFFTRLEIPAPFYLLFWFGMQFLNGFESIGDRNYTGGGMAWFAHIGGFLAGMLLIRLFPVAPALAALVRRRVGKQLASFFRHGPFFAALEDFESLLGPVAQHVRDELAFDLVGRMFRSASGRAIWHRCRRPVGRLRSPKNCLPPIGSNATFTLNGRRCAASSGYITQSPA